MRLAPVQFLSASLGALGLQASAAMETAVAGAEYDRSFLGRQALGNN